MAHIFILAVLLTIVIQVFSLPQSRKDLKRHRLSEWRDSRTEDRSTLFSGRHRKNDRKMKGHPRQMEEEVVENSTETASLQKYPKGKSFPLFDPSSPSNENIPGFLQELLPGIKTLSLLAPSHLTSLTSGLLESAVPRSFNVNNPSSPLKTPPSLPVTPSYFAWLAESLIDSFSPRKFLKATQTSKTSNIIDKSETIQTHVANTYEKLKEDYNAQAMKNLDLVLPCAILPVPYNLFREAVMSFNSTLSPFLLPRTLKPVPGTSDNFVKTLTGLAIINPALLSIFRHFNNPSATPFLVALDRLLQSASSLHITENKSSGSRFYSTIRFPLEVQLSTSNAFLVFLDAAFPYNNNATKSYTPSIESIPLINRILDIMYMQQNEPESSGFRYPSNDMYSVDYPFKPSCVLSRELEKRMHSPLGKGLNPQHTYWDMKSTGEEKTSFVNQGTDKQNLPLVRSKVTSNGNQGRSATTFPIEPPLTIEISNATRSEHYSNGEFDGTPLPNASGPSNNNNNNNVRVFVVTQRPGTNNNRTHGERLGSKDGTQEIETTRVYVMEPNRISSLDVQRDLKESAPAEATLDLLNFFPPTQDSLALASEDHENDATPSLLETVSTNVKSITTLPILPIF